jgi:2-amino-4-hydroxy-6-hydroxymethyldihydropteridine diphosphokinase
LSAAGQTETHQVYLGLGSNIRPEDNLAQAYALLQQSVRVEAVSHIWETPPVGSSGPNFLNAAARVSTGLSLADLRARILKPIEEGLGRVRTGDPNAPRTIDLDVLIFDGVALDENIWEQAHVCVPLAELIPDYAKAEGDITLGQVATRFRQAYPLRLRKDLNGLACK